MIYAAIIGDHFAHFNSLCVYAWFMLYDYCRESSESPDNVTALSVVLSLYLPETIF
jgi:hypothetical protein